MTIHQILEIASDNVEKAQMLSSAMLCLDDAITLTMRGNIEDAKIRALKSLAYSVGKSSPIYLEAAA